MAWHDVMALMTWHDGMAWWHDMRHGMTWHDATASHDGSDAQWCHASGPKAHHSDGLSAPSALSVHPGSKLGVWDTPMQVPGMPWRKGEPRSEMQMAFPAHGIPVEEPFPCGVGKWNWESHLLWGVGNVRHKSPFLPSWAESFEHHVLPQWFHGKLLTGVGQEPSHQPYSNVPCLHSIQTWKLF